MVFKRPYMPAPLSLDLRKRILEALLTSGTSQKKIALRFCVGKATVERLARLHRETGSVAPRPPCRRPRSVDFQCGFSTGDRVIQNGPGLAPTANCRPLRGNGAADEPAIGQPWASAAQHYTEKRPFGRRNSSPKRFRPNGLRS